MKVYNVLRISFMSKIISKHCESNIKENFSFMESCEKMRNKKLEKQ